jgi:Protein of unknown function (DUF1559)
MTKETEHPDASQVQAAAARSPVNGAQGRDSHFGPHWPLEWRATSVKSFTVVITLALGVLARAEEPEPDAQARMIAPFLSPQTIAVGYVRVETLDPAAIWQQITGMQGRKSKDGLEKSINDWVAGFRKAGGRELYVVLDLADLPQNAPNLIVPLGRETDPQPLIDFLQDREKKNGEGGGALPFYFQVCEKVNGAIFCGSRQARERIRTGKSPSGPELVRAFEALKGAPVGVLFVPSADTRRVLDEMIPPLPAVGRVGGSAPNAGGAESGRIISQGLLWAALGVRPPPHPTLQLVIQSESAAAAERLSRLLDTAFKALAQRKEMREMVPNIDRFLDRLTPEVQGDRVVVAADEKTLTALLPPLVSRTEEAARRTTSMNRLKQIGLAMHNYHDINKSFPPAAKCKDGKRLLSWRVLILPLVEQQKLYEQFHLDEPWDSDHNRKLIPRMPEVYHSSLSLPAGKTTFLGIAGQSGMFPGCQGLRIRDVTDGTSNTIFVVDADDARAVDWTKPEDLTPDPERPLDGLLGHFPDGFLALFVDASVRFIPKTVSPKTVKALFTRNGGEVPDKDY